MRDRELDEVRVPGRGKPAPVAPARDGDIGTLLDMQRMAGNQAVARAVAGDPTLARKGLWDSVKGLFSSGAEQDTMNNPGIGPGGVPFNPALGGASDTEPDTMNNPGIGPGGVPFNPALGAPNQDGGVPESEGPEPTGAPDGGVPGGVPLEE